jgi:PAS domain S-box-containing protein
MSREIVKLLRKTPIFSFLDPNSLTKISELFKEATYTSGHLFFRDDTVNDILYIIKQGAVKIVKTGKRGEGKLSFILRREGDFFGETALIEETSPLETAQAINNTRVLQLSRSDFLTIVSSYPFVAFQIMKALTSRLRNSYLGLIEELGEKDEQLEKASVDSKSSIDQEGKGMQYREERVSFSDEMISGFPFSIVATREDGTIFIFNQSAEKEYGYSSEEVLGKSMDWLRGEENASNLNELIKEALKDKGIWNGEIIGKRKNGEMFLSEATVYEIVDPQSARPVLLWVTREMARKPAFVTEAGVKRPMDLVRFMEKELLLLKPQERFKGIEFITKFDEKLPLVEIDPQKMTEILTTLLDHAAFSLKEVSNQEKTVVIQIRYLAQDEEVEIQILDTGKGIREDDLPKVFQEHSTTKDRGIGFGLFSVKNAVEANGGNIEVQSMEGAYTLFTIRFPVKKQVLVQPEEPSPAMIPSA